VDCAFLHATHKRFRLLQAFLATHREEVQEWQWTQRVTL